MLKMAVSRTAHGVRTNIRALVRRNISDFSCVDIGYVLTKQPQYSVSKNYVKVFKIALFIKSTVYGKQA